MMRSGKVYLVGAGPGDIGLMTLRGKEVLGRADVIVYDYLVNTVFLSFKKENAEVIYVGKKRGHKELTQKEINKLLVSRARAGKTVARLKGGDPFIFGRGGEEAEALNANKIECEIVPGVTSASAVPAYAGIPLTHRDYSSSFVVVTGHEDPKKIESLIPWDALAKIGTVVFLMSVRNLAANMKKLIDSGRDADTPAALISWGTYPHQVSLVSTIGRIADDVKKRDDLGAPAVIITGEVVRMKNIIDWYESKPLFGRNIVVTRASKQAGTFSAALSAEGANVIEFPVIDIRPPRSWKKTDRAIDNLSHYDWIVFTSVNGVRGFFNRLRELGKDIRTLHGLKISAIGEKTADSLDSKGLIVDIVPGDYVAESLIKSFRKQNIDGCRVLIPRAKVARDVLPVSLRELGASVDVVTCYETVKPATAQLRKLKNMLAGGEIDAVTFTSSSTVRNFLSIAGKDSLRNTAVACIGPVTAKTVRENGYKVSVMPKKYTIEALTDEISRYFSRTVK